MVSKEQFCTYRDLIKKASNFMSNSDLSQKALDQNVILDEEDVVEIKRNYRHLNELYPNYNDDYEDDIPLEISSFDEAYEQAFMEDSISP